MIDSSLGPTATTHSIKISEKISKRGNPRKFIPRKLYGYFDIHLYSDVCGTPTAPSQVSHDALMLLLLRIAYLFHKMHLIMQLKYVRVRLSSTFCLPLQLLAKPLLLVSTVYQINIWRRPTPLINPAVSAQ